MSAHDHHIQQGTVTQAFDVLGSQRWEGPDGSLNHGGLLLTTGYRGGIKNLKKENQKGECRFFHDSSSLHVLEGNGDCWRKK